MSPFHSLHNRQIRLLVAVTIMAWATQTLVQQWGYGQELPPSPAPMRFVPHDGNIAGGTLELRSEAIVIGTDVTVRAVEEVLKESERLRSEGVSDEELTNARDYLIGILPLQMQTTGQLASALAELVTYGLPLDYYDNYRDRIAAVTAEDIRRVAREHMRPETFAIVVVGDAASVREGIEGLKHGTVYEVKPNGGTA